MMPSEERGKAAIGQWLWFQGGGGRRQHGARSVAAAVPLAAASRGPLGTPTCDAMQYTRFTVASGGIHPLQRLFHSCKPAEHAFQHLRHGLTHGAATCKACNIATRL